MPQASSAGTRRETRLLLATIAVSVGMLLLLARFRFPEEATRLGAETVPAPLERLAARATYDELASVMVDLERRVIPTIEVLRIQSPRGPAYSPAVRVAADRAVALLPRDHRVVGLGASPAPSILARDALRELVVLQLAPTPDSAVVVPAAAPTRPGPRYVVIVEATARAPAVRPVYVGRTDLFADPRWADPVLSVAAVQQTLSIGSAVFSLDGAFIGLAAESNGTIMVIPAETLRHVAAVAPMAPAQRGSLHVDVQPLTPEITRATGAEKGVVVAWVTPAAGANLLPGDVIQSIDEVGITTVAGFQQVEQSRTPGAPVTLGVLRRGQPVTVTMTAADATAVPPFVNHDNLGAVLRSITGVGAEVITVEPDGPAGRAGLAANDLVIALDGRVAPDASAIERAYRSARPDDAMLLTIRRNGEHRVVTLAR